MGSKCRRPPTFSFRTTADLRQEIRNIFSFFPEFPIKKSFHLRVSPSLYKSISLDSFLFVSFAYLDAYAIL